MFKALTEGSVKLVGRYLPDPFLFCVILTLVVFGFGLTIGNTPSQMVQFWGEGFWNLLSFSMQMLLVLVTGHTLAQTQFFKRILSSVAATVHSPGTAIMLTTFVSALASWINWGFGLVIGALLAKEIARKVDKVDYRLLIASAYSGFIVWHGGLSSSVSLTVATNDHFAMDMIGVIPTSETIFSAMNLTIVISLVIAIPILNRFMHPEPGREIVYRPANDAKEEVAVATANSTPADKLENSKLISLVISLIGFWFIIAYFSRNGFSLNLDIVNFIFLFFAIFLHRTPRRFLQAAANAVKGTTGIVIQFPFYAGIMGMMVASGLAAVVSEWFVSVSNETTFPLFAFWSAGIVNFFVPSGGGQWAVQAPIMLPAGAELGVDAAKTAIAIAWGDAWTNLIQPFWALPALAIAGLGARDIMGYCLIILFVSGAIISLGFLLF
ncbi:short-chain fatty acid transporter [Bacillus sp. B15-48]|uniref:short-chain fatty acid transporter n=1 Tax=Bacillus sp. B15-48 TaxID=1548601 RepID=UPI00193F3989|nr:short-chain fatty acid transporter [Bacillus sp. B15-48]MBM4761057.1 short-chain fatty acid transporter [Bacillus sp. B15-48]